MFGQVTREVAGSVVMHLQDARVVLRLVRDDRERLELVGDDGALLLQLALGALQHRLAVVQLACEWKFARKGGQEREEGDFDQSTFVQNSLTAS